MATTVVRRPERKAAPEMPQGELVLDAPPEIPDPPPRQWTQLLYVLPTIAIMGGMLLTFGGGFGSAGSLRYLMFGLFGVAIIGTVVATLVTGGGPSKKEMGQARRRYLRELSQHRARVGRTVREQREALWYLHPEPEQLWALVHSHRLWEHRADDPDFCVARVGLGKQGLATTLVPPDTKPLEQLEPLSALALRRFITTYATIGGLPLALAVSGFARIHLTGDREKATGLVRAIIAQLATFQSPDDLRIALCPAPECRDEWDWVKWLPHALHPERSDALGPLRLVAPTVTALEAMLDDLIADRPRFDPDGPYQQATPQIVVIVDGGSGAGSDHLMTDGGLEGVTVIELCGQPPRMLDRSTLVLRVDEDGTLTSRTADSEDELGIADDVTDVVAEALARELSPLRLTGHRGETPLSAELGLADLLDLGDPYSFDPAETWVPRPSRDRLRVRFGIRPDGTPVELDLKESAQNGMGPHGLLIGATGSGKSELLRTLVLALAVTHPPNQLNFALVDFKGGATFTRLDRLPHTSAVITNLADELPLVDRMADAISGELVRRQELLRAAGNYASLRDYEKARAAGAPLPEVPTLLVVCDEFSELLTARPDFIDMFVQIGRVGRALGVHLLLASQRLEEGRLRGLDTQLSFRIGLRTFSEMESRVVLGVSDAFKLPSAPGHGYLKVGTDPMTRFRSAYVSGVHRAPGTQVIGEREALGLLEYTTDYVAPPVEEEVEEPQEDLDEAIGESLLDILVDRLEGNGVPAHQVWLPPLDESPTLDALAVEPHRLTAAIGIVDKPFDQRRDPLLLDFSGAGGHALVTGGPRAGKSTALRTIVLSLALNHTPREVQFYCLDFGGGSLAALRGLPHVGGVSSRQNAGAVRRTVAEVAAVLTARERRFAELEIDGMAGYRDRRPADDPHGDVFLVIDGWLAVRKEFDDLEETITGIATRGLAYGVHLIVACSRAFDLRAAMRDQFGARVELRLGDPIDSTVDRVSALSVPENAPGRGVTSSKHQMLIALPRTDGQSTTDGLAAATGAVVDTIARSWHGQSAPAVRLLPAEVLSLPAPDGMRLPIGIAEHDLMPVRVDFSADAHLLLFGDSGAGKTSFLRLLGRQLIDHFPPGGARIILLDHRRKLLGELDSEHLLGYGTDVSLSTGLLAEAARGMKGRLPGPDVTPEQLRNRSWWSGPELFVLVDDYDLVGASVLAPLMEFLPQAADIGLHVVLTRRSGGAGKAMYDPVITRLRDVGAHGLLLSGDRAEGALLGGLKPESLPPGRGRLISRGESPALVQLGWTGPS